MKAEEREIRRECSNHMIVLGERHLKRIVSSYVRYWSAPRTLDQCYVRFSSI